MENNIEDEINKLNPEQRKLFDENLIGICECKDSCINYGAKNPISLPKEDMIAIKAKLYNELFGSSERYKTR